MNTKWKKYDNDEDRIKVYKRQQNIYSNGKKWKCDVCNCETNLGNKTRHLKSEKHLNNINGDSIEYPLKDQWRCTVCDIVICTRNMSNHLKSQRHRRNGCPTCSESDGDESDGCSSSMPNRLRSERQQSKEQERQRRKECPTCSESENDESDDCYENALKESKIY